MVPLSVRVSLTREEPTTVGELEERSGSRSRGGLGEIECLGASTASPREWKSAVGEEEASSEGGAVSAVSSSSLAESTSTPVSVRSGLWPGDPLPSVAPSSSAVLGPSKEASTFWVGENVPCVN